MGKNGGDCNGTTIRNIKSIIFTQKTKRGLTRDRYPSDSINKKDLIEKLLTEVLEESFKRKKNNKKEC